MSTVFVDVAAVWKQYNNHRSNVICEKSDLSMIAPGMESVQINGS